MPASPAAGGRRPPPLATATRSSAMLPPALSPRLADDSLMSSAAPEPNPPVPPVQGWVKLTPCAKCGQAIDPTRAVYSKYGELVCKGCDAGDLITDGYLRAAKGSCFGALITGIVSLVFFIFFAVFFVAVLLLSVAAVAQGIRALILINRREYRQVLASQYASMMIAAIAGTLFGAFSLLGFVFVLLAVSH